MKVIPTQPTGPADKGNDTDTSVSLAELNERTAAVHSLMTHYMKATTESLERMERAIQDLRERQAT